MHRLLQSVLRMVARVVLRAPRTVVLVSLALSVLCAVVAARRFQVVNNVAQLLDADSPVNRNYLEFKREFGSDEMYLVLVRSESPARNREAAAQVAAFLETLRPQVAKVFWKIDFERLKNRELLLVPSQELAGMERDLSEFSTTAQRRNISLDLSSVLAEANRSFDDAYLRKKENWREFKPFIERFKGILSQLADTLEQAPAPKPAGAAPGWLEQDPQRMLEEQQYLSLDGGKALVVMAERGALDEDSTSPYTKTVAAIRAKLQELRGKFPGVRFDLTGEPVLNDDELRTSERDTLWASLLTAAGIAVLFRVSYRRLSRPVCAALALAMAMSWTFAFAMLVVGHFNVISFAIIPMALGLGIDFGIQILGRYEEELSEGRSIEQAAQSALAHTGVAVLTGGSTTAVAFFTLCFNEFLGLRELGLIAGASMVLCLAANIFTLPALLVWRDHRRQRRAGGDVLESGAAFAHQPEANWEFLAPWNERLLARPRLVLLTSGLLTLAALIGFVFIRFDYNLLHLQSRRLESVRVLQELFRLSGNSTIFASVIADDLEQARALEQRLAALAPVSRVESVTQLVPAADEQARRLALARQLGREARELMARAGGDQRPQDPARIQQNLARLLEESRAGAQQARKFSGISSQAREAAEVFDGLIPPLERALAALRRLSPEQAARRLDQSQSAIFGKMRSNLQWLAAQQTDRPLTLQDVPTQLRARFLAPSGKVLLQVFGKRDLWEREPNVEFVQAVRQVAPDATGTPVQNYEYTELLRTSFLEAALWALVAIVILLALHFQSVRLVWLALFPLLLAVVWRTGLMGWVGLPFNPANVVTLPLILGIDVAYGVYVIDRYREDGSIKILGTSTGKAIILTGLTAFIGFASLLVSSHAGMFSIGLLMSVGILLGMVTTLVILPQLILFKQRRRQARAATPTDA